MKHFIFLLSTVLLLAFNGNAQQDKYIKHKVAKTETVIQIAQKFKVTPFDIYRLNPDSQRGIQENDVLLIPVSSSKVKANDASVVVKAQPAKFRTHLVEPKETLYSIARTYNVSVDDLNKTNAELLKEGLKIGQIIAIPNGFGASAQESKEQIKAMKDKLTVSKQEPIIYHIVEPKETKYAISRKYGITVEELERQNPEITESLPVGYRLVIKSNSVKEDTVAPSADRPILIKQVVKPVGIAQPQTGSAINGFVFYEVKAKETLFSLSQQFAISQEELLGMNPSLKEGVKIGMLLKVPGNSTAQITSQKDFVDLAQSINTRDKKELVLLLPFNAAKIQGDSLKSIASRLKKDAFLNMTLDFYSGALMAIDSARVLGLNINVRIFDSEESKNSSNVEQLVRKHNLQNSDAIIGPFYQQYLEKVAEMLQGQKVPVISPLSKDTGKPYNNLYQAMPPSDFSKSALLNYMLSKNGNIIVVSDPKKLANREFITQNYPQTKFVVLNETGGLVPENLKALLVPGRMNYVIMDSERTAMILATTRLLLSEKDTYQLQLAILEPNETLDFDEISLKRLTDLKMLYPSLTRENTAVSTKIFEKEYKKKNKIFPSQFATRGFDVTFDTMLRLSQGKSFEASANEDNTEMAESKFEYVKKQSGSYVNKGVFILYYDEDLSVKEAN